MFTKFFASKEQKKKIASDSHKVVVIGTGAVGSSAAFALMIEGTPSELVLIDANHDKCLGEACDLEHGLSFVRQIKVKAGTYEDCQDADVIVISAGAAQKPGQTRLELVDINSKIIAEIVNNIKKYTSRAIILMVTNPLDVLTYVALKTSGYPAGQVFGTGTTLDSSRFRYFLAEEFHVAPDSMGAYLIGEHGDSSVPVYSHCNVMGEPLKNLPGYSHEKLERSYQKARDSAAYLIKKKGYTSYGIGLAVARIVRAILYDENHTFPVSVYLNGQYGFSDVYLSLPAVIGRTGVKKILDAKLSENEEKLLHKSAEIIKETIASIK